VLHSKTQPYTHRSGAADTTKRYVYGTHRIRSPEETWDWVRPYFDTVGITRVADVTRLDRLGIPVYQAVRPASRNLAVSQGKAITEAGARVSAVMEAVELWHAQCLDHVPQVEMSLREMRYDNPIDDEVFHWRPDSRLAEALAIPWVQASALTGERDAWLPRGMIELDFTLPHSLQPHMFYLTSNGLASGNCREEALVHALSELVERHALFLDHTHRRPVVALDVDSIDCEAGLGLIRCVRQAGMKLALYDATWEVGVPVVVAELVAPDLPNVWRGSGCHPSPEVALTRAITEAAQSRLTYIAGSRDDLIPFAEQIDTARPFDTFRPPDGTRRFGDLAGVASANVGADLERLVERLAECGFDAFHVDLTREDLRVPVVRAFVPGLKEAPYG